VRIAHAFVVKAQFALTSLARQIVFANYPNQKKLIMTISVSNYFNNVVVLTVSRTLTDANK
jgi:hypothetical protein